MPYPTAPTSSSLAPTHALPPSCGQGQQAGTCATSAAAGLPGRTGRRRASQAVPATLVHTHYKPPMDCFMTPVQASGPRYRAPGLVTSASRGPEGELPGGLVLAQRESFHAACEQIMTLVCRAEASCDEATLHDLVQAVAAAARAASHTMPLYSEKMNRMQLAQDQSVTQLYRATLRSALMRMKVNYALLKTPELLRLGTALVALNIPLGRELKALLHARVQGACLRAFGRAVSATLSGDAAASRLAYVRLCERSSDLIALHRLNGEHAALNDDVKLQARRESLMSAALNTLTPERLALLDNALKASYVRASAGADLAGVSGVIRRAHADAHDPYALQRRMMARAATDMRQIREARQAVRQMADITIAKFDAVDRSNAPVSDQRNEYDNLTGLLAKTVRERCLELPAAKDHPDVISEMMRARQRGLEGMARLIAMERSAAVASLKISRWQELTTLAS